MSCRSVARRSAPGKQKLTASRIVIDSTPHDIPHLGNLLPLVDEQRPRPSQQKTWIGVHRLTVGLCIESQQADDTLLGSRRLPHCLRTIDRDRRYLSEQLIQLIVNDTSHIPHEPIIQLAADE